MFALEEPLGLFDANILHVTLHASDHGRSSRRRRAALQAAFRDAAFCDRASNRLRPAITRARPVLGLAHDRVGVRLTPGIRRASPAAGIAATLNID